MCTVCLEGDSTYLTLPLRQPPAAACVYLQLFLPHENFRPHENRLLEFLVTRGVECVGAAVVKMIVEEAPRPEDAGIIMSAAFSPDGLLFAGGLPNTPITQRLPTPNVLNTP